MEAVSRTNSAVRTVRLGSGIGSPRLDQCLARVDSWKRELLKLTRRASQASGLCRGNRIEPSRLYCAFEIMHHVRLADGLGQPSPRASCCSGGQVTSSARLRNRSVFGQRSSTDAPPWAAAMSDPYRCSAKIARRRAFGVLPVLVVDERGRVLMREWPDTNSVLHCEIT